jgi:diadenosine tetraphosphate (Ap4A) HIT family hydrolase
LYDDGEEKIMIKALYGPNSEFEIDSQLESSSILVRDLPLCQVRLKNDRRFPWVVLIPRQPHLTEVFDLTSEDQHQLWSEVILCAQHIHKTFAAYKMNIEILGNKVRQLHIHIIARYETDAAWPNSVLNYGAVEPYAFEEISTILQKVTF